MNIEGILIEGIGTGQAFVDINNETLDIRSSEKQGVYQYLYDDDEPNEIYVGMDRDVLYVDKIFIEEKYRKRGIGSKIVK